MIKVFTGDDRVKAKQEIERFLGNNYEVFDGSDLKIDDLPNIFFGNSLLSAKRAILIRDLSLNQPLFEKLENYLDTPHQVALFELKIDKRSSTYKLLKSKNLIYEYSLSKNPDYRLVFDIFSVAKRNGNKAVEMLEKIKNQEDPIMFLGLLISSAIKDFSRNQGIKEKNVLKSLSQLDLKLKSTSLDPWLLIESFLIELNNHQKNR